MVSSAAIVSFVAIFLIKMLLPMGMFYESDLQKVGNLLPLSIIHKCDRLLRI